ncbi:uncharacterized protein [Nicotiana tomentosiformis]|uniref:uncharacterized protein n=1 Tax=Nicotiana tomentosiformis TaxID=4098 RepID=UPI00388CC10C
MTYVIVVPSVQFTKRFLECPVQFLTLRVGYETWLQPLHTPSARGVICQRADGRTKIMAPVSQGRCFAPVSKPVKDNNRKKVLYFRRSKTEDEDARKPRKNTIPLIEELVRRLRDEDEEEEENDGSVLVARVKKIIDAPKAARSMVVYEGTPRTEGILEKGSGKVPELLEIEDASHRSQHTVDISEGTIREAQALGTLEVDGSHEGEDPFRDLFTGIEDVAGPSDASGLFHEAATVHREACSRSRAELRRYKADLRRVTEEKNALKLLFGQRGEEIKDLRAELSKAHQDQTDLTEQQKLEVVGKLRKEVDVIKAESLEWKEGMDHLATEKDAAQAQLLSAEGQLQGLKEKSSVQVRNIEELEAQYQSRRETLEEIHARGFDLTEEIKKAKELEADAGALASDNDDDNDDDDGRKSGSESGEEPDGEETSPGDN